MLSHPSCGGFVARQPILRLIAKTMQARAKRACSQFAERSLPSTKAMQARAKGACSPFAERSLLFAKLAKKRSVACSIDKNIWSMRKIDFYLSFLLGLLGAAIPSGYGLCRFELR